MGRDSAQGQNLVEWPVSLFVSILKLSENTYLLCCGIANEALAQRWILRPNSNAQYQRSKNLPSDGLPIYPTAADMFFEDFRLALFTAFATPRLSFLQ
ncbi:MAG TPA: hypothetical protein VMP68_11930 [Candidatus Eisenbacteria bacterium]|nr:hypothetical protein [Candidatus Eisenbacteria bacterium]